MTEQRRLKACFLRNTTTSSMLDTLRCCGIIHTMQARTTHPCHFSGLTLQRLVAYAVNLSMNLLDVEHGLTLENMSNAVTLPLILGIQ